MTAAGWFARREGGPFEGSGCPSAVLDPLLVRDSLALAQATHSVVRIAVEGADLDCAASIAEGVAVCGALVRAAGLHTLNEVDHGQDEQSHGQQDPQGI